MNKRRVVLAAAVWLAVSPLARADTVMKIDGQARGDVVETSATEVTLQARGSTARTKVPVNEIRSILFTDEPARLNTARTAIDAGRNEDAVTGLEGINVAEVRRKEIKQDVAFYTALAKARIALAGTDANAIVEAGRLMAAFVNEHPSSYHYLEACEVVGDMLVAAGKHTAAQDYYGRVAQAPWPDYQMRAGVALGRALLAEGKTDEALKRFQSVLDTEATGESAAQQRLAATLGKARCQAEAGQADEAVKLIQGVIDKADKEQTQLHAQAYNALGLAHRKAGRVQDALLAYLHVDTLYFNSPKEHIEALESLVELWEEAQLPERAERETRILQERYGRSPGSQ
jgi:tetratricopeptide (TPR) repeat protein